MGAIARATLAHLRVRDLQKMLTDLDTGEAQVEKLTDYAMDSPDSRNAVIAALQQHAKKYAGTRRATAAMKAISSIITVEMLEVLYSKGSIAQQT